MPFALRLSLVHQTVLLLVAAVLIAVSALGGVVAWNLGSGFNDYLRLQDQAWLERFVRVAAEAVARDGLSATLDGPPGTLNALLVAAGPPDQRGPPAEDLPPPEHDRAPRGADLPPRRLADGPARSRRLPPGAQRYASRLSLVTAAGRPLAATVRHGAMGCWSGPSSWPARSSPSPSSNGARRHRRRWMRPSWPGSTAASCWPA